MRKINGFTLVELVVTIVILSIVSVVTTKFIVKGFEFYIGANNVQQLSMSANFVSEKIEKLIENAVPNSISITDGGRKISFVPIKSSLGFVYLPKEKSSPFDSSNPVVYAIKSEIYNLSRIKNLKNLYVAFNNYGINEEYFAIKNIVEDGNLIKIILDVKSGQKFIPASERGRLYVVEGDENSVRFVSINVNSKNQLVMFNHYSDGKKGTEQILSSNVSSAIFSKVLGAYSQYGEVQIEFSYLYPYLDGVKTVYQRIGVANAP